MLHSAMSTELSDDDATELAQGFVDLAELAERAESTPYRRGALEWLFRLYQAGGRPVHPDLCWLARELWRPCLWLGDIEAATGYLTFALNGEREAHGATHAVVAALEADVAELSVQTGRPDVAAAHGELAVQHADAVLDSGNPARAKYRIWLGSAYLKLGDQARAPAVLADAVHIGEAIGGDAWQEHAEGLNILGLLSRDAGELDLAVSYFRRAVEALGDRTDEAEFTRAQILGNLANVYLFQQRYDEAMALQSDVLARRRAILPPHHLEVAIMIGNVGLLHGFLGDHDAAAAHHREALAILRQWHGENGPHTLRTALNLGRALVKAGNVAEGRRELRWVAGHEPEGENDRYVEAARESLGIQD